MKTFPEMRNLDILNLVQPLDRNDSEDAGYRICPSCLGASYAHPEKYFCKTCYGAGEINLYDI